MPPLSSALFLLGFARTIAMTTPLGPPISPPTPPPGTTGGFDLDHAPLTSNNVGGQAKRLHSHSATPHHHLHAHTTTRRTQGPNFDDSQEQRYCMPLPRSQHYQPPLAQRL
jgi:hypothetical protein